MDYMDFPRQPNETEPEHIGDGVYVTHDGYHIWLRTFREYRWESIALDPEVYGKLVEYAQWVRGKAVAND